MWAFLSGWNDPEQAYEAEPRRAMLVTSQGIFQRKIHDILDAIRGVQVVAATTSCQEALETAKRLSIDLVVTELFLKDGSSMDLTTYLKQLPVPPPIIVFSDTLNATTLMQVILAGAHDYLLKDTPAREIIRTFKNFQRTQAAAYTPFEGNGSVVQAEEDLYKILLSAFEGLNL